MLDHQLRGGGVRELREHHDERAALELLQEHVHAEHVVGLGGLGREGREGATDARHLTHAARERRPRARRVGVRVNRDEIARLERDLAEQERRVDRVVEALETVDGIAHQAAGVDAEDDALVLLEPEAADEGGLVACARLPVDGAKVHAGLVGLEAVELAAVTTTLDHVHAAVALRTEVREGELADALGVGDDGDLFVERVTIDATQEAHRSVETRPERTQSRAAATWSRDGHHELRGGARTHVDVRAWLERRVDLRAQRGVKRQRALHAEAHEDVEVVADADRSRNVRLERGARAQEHHRVEEHAPEEHRPQPRDQRPQRWIDRDGQRGDREAREGDPEEAVGGDHRYVGGGIGDGGDGSDGSDDGGVSAARGSE